MRIRFLILILAGFLSCQNIEDASPAGISSFIRLYEKPGNFIASDVEVLSDGYALVGYTGSNETASVVFIITDSNGNIVRETTHPGSTAKSLHVLKNNSGGVEGFIVIGDVIDVNPGVEPVANQEIISSRILKLGTDGTFISERLIKDPEINPSAVKVDFRTSAITQKNADTLVLLGSFRTVLNEPEKPFLAGLDEDLNPLWFNNFPSIDRTYINSKSVFYHNDDILWACAKLKQTGDFSDSFLSIPLTPDQALTPTNDSPYKQLSSQLLIANELQPIRNGAVGYGLIGTIASTSGDLSNMIFIQVNPQGYFKEETVRFFDGQNGETEQEISAVQDTGDALFPTSDGGFILAGTSLSTPTFGKGGRDIVLIKLDNSGNTEWNKVIGGSGDETVCAVRETKGGYLICGSSNVGSLSSAFLIKTDKKGELKN